MMLFITPSQCRAARGLLNWTQPELAQRSGVDVQTISNFEKDTSTPSKSTLEKIVMALMLGGVLLSDNEGVKKADKIVSVMEGPDAFYRYLDGIYEDLKNKPGSEILISGLAEAQPGDEYRAFVEMHIDRLRKAGITERLLIKEGDVNLIAPKEWYRHIPPEFFISSTFQLHGDKLALHEDSPPGGRGNNATTKRIVILESKLFAEAFRKLFNFAWAHAQPVK